MACGRPVLAFGNGSVPEVIDDGVTGRIVHTMAEAVAALPGVLALDRRGVRRTFERRFTAGRMARDYVEIYKQQVAGAKTHLGVQDGTALPVDGLMPRNGVRFNKPAEIQ